MNDITLLTSWIGDSEEDEPNLLSILDDVVLVSQLILS